MTNFLNQITHCYSLFNRIVTPSFFLGKANEFQKTFSLPLFYSKVWKKFCNKIFLMFSKTNPCKYIVCLFSSMNNSSRIKRIYKANYIFKSIRCRKLVTKTLLSCSGVCAFITRNISISIKKTCKPFYKIGFPPPALVQSDHLVGRIFISFYERNKMFACYATLFACLIDVREKREKLRLFNKTKFTNFVDKVRALTTGRGQYPSPGNFSFISFSSMDASAKFRLKNLWNAFVCNFNGYTKFSIRAKRYTPLSIEKTGIVMHKYIGFGKTHFNINRFRLQRLNPKTQG